jgi:hypothetical protein
MGGNPWTCLYSFGITAISTSTQSFRVVNPRSTDQLLVLGSNANLWLEHAPFGNVPPAREQVDGGVHAFQPIDNQTVLALGNNGKLWLEHAPFGNVPPAREQVDGNVRAFQGLDSQTVLVLGTDEKLWLESGPFGNVPPPGFRSTVTCKASRGSTFRPFWCLGQTGIFGLRRTIWKRPTRQTAN